MIAFSFFLSLFLQAFTAQYVICKEIQKLIHYCVYLQLFTTPLAPYVQTFIFVLGDIRLSTKSFKMSLNTHIFIDMSIKVLSDIQIGLKRKI